MEEEEREEERDWKRVGPFRRSTHIGYSGDRERKVKSYEGAVRLPEGGLARLRSRIHGLSSSGLLADVSSCQMGCTVGSLQWGGCGACPREEAGEESGIGPPKRNLGAATSVSKMRPRNTRQAGDKLHQHP